MIASFKSEDRCRVVQILVAEKPQGPFKVLLSNAITPTHWECCDGTFYVDNGKPYLIFCYEWTDIIAGTINALELSSDLKNTVGEPIILIKDSEDCIIFLLFII